MIDVPTHTPNTTHSVNNSGNCTGTVSVKLLIGDACLPRLATGFTTSFGTLGER
jgi:hypothetical protein